jgi:uracil phosphoribosyltransferase
MTTDDKLHVLAHPLIDAELSKLRQKSTNPKEFREVLSISSGFRSLGTGTS